MAERIDNLTKPGFPSLQFDIMNAFCFALVLFATRIIYTKEESPVDQNKTASAWRVRTDDHGIDFGKVELFKDELPRAPKDLKSASKQSKPLIISTRRGLPKNGTVATAKGSKTPAKIYEDYDATDLQLDKFKLLVSSNKYKTINASHVRFPSRNPNPTTNSSASPTGIKKPSYPLDETATNLSKPAVSPDLIPSIKVNNSVTPISWVISPACSQQNESKYVFSAFFDKKPTVRLMETADGAAPSDETPKILINDSSVIMSAGKATAKATSSKATQSKDPAKGSKRGSSTGNKTTLDTNIKPLIGDSLLKGISGFTMTIKNNSKPRNYLTLSKFGDPLVISGQIKNPENGERPSAPAQQSKTFELAPKLQGDVSVRSPTLRITSQATNKLGQIPLFVLENGLLQAPLPGIPSKQGLSTPQQAMTNVLNSDVGQRSLFPAELDQNFERPTKKDTVGNLITQKETDAQSSDLLYELFKNITITNVINEDLNRKLLGESQIHTQQNWQLIKGNTDIINTLKNKNEHNGSS